MIFHNYKKFFTEKAKNKKKCIYFKKKRLYYRPSKKHPPLLSWRSHIPRENVLYVSRTAVNHPCSGKGGSRQQKVKRYVAQAVFCSLLRNMGNYPSFDEKMKPVIWPNAAQAAIYPDGTFNMKGFGIMDLKKLAMITLTVVMGASLFIGCAKPPTEKVDALNAQFTQLQEKGAQVFAMQQYDLVSAQMTELQGLMDQKKYKDAAAKADSVTTAMEELTTALETNGQQMAQAEVASANEEIVKFKAFIDGNKKVLVGDEAKKFTDQTTAVEGQIAGLQAELDAKNFLNAYNTAKSVKDQLAAATQEVTASIEAAKTKKGGK